MINWNDPNTKLIIYLIYGTSFILMSIAMTVKRKRVASIEFMKDFRYLALFGLIHGISEYSEIPRFLAWQPLWIYDSIKLVLESISFTVLFSFGLFIITIDMKESIWWIRGIPYGALLMYFWLLFIVGIDFKNTGIGIDYNVAEVGMRNSLGFLGAAITSYSFIYLSGKVKDVIGEYAYEILFIAGMCFGLYAIFGGIIIGNFIGIPVVVFRTVIAILITISVIEIFQLFRIDIV